MSDTKAEPPLVFIYDRYPGRLGRGRGILNLRLEGCQNWAAAQRWEIVGRWVDLGDQALTDEDRPRFDELVTDMAEMSEVAPGRSLICLVHHWDRLTRHGNRGQYQHRITAAGGYTSTTFGDDDQATTLAAPGEAR
ncbi:hypothetical protein [Streptomyces sp. NPDC093109]|uniref:hypothetical protein n=1 Tax=Streptomyces sp. NPDC093109 TaxID=3154977 RepID=UPI00344F520A